MRLTLVDELTRASSLYRAGDWSQSQRGFLLVRPAAIKFIQADRHSIPFLAILKTKEQNIEHSQKAIAALRALAESNSHHLRTISHDFRTPLQTVVATVELLTVVLEKSEERHVAAALRNLDTASKQLLQLSNELSQSIKNNATNITTKPVDTNLIEFLTESIKQYHAESHSKKIALRFRHDKPSVEKAVDRARLHRIVMHLIDNAANETTDGVVQLECTQTIEGEILVCVGYNGKLMSANDLTYILEPWLLDEVSHEGVRLELATAKALAKSIGAKIHINSSMASGTIVTLTLS